MLKKVLFFMLVLNSLTSGVAFSQQQILNQKISISAINQPLSMILEHLEKKCNYTFSYNNSTVNGSKKVSIKMENATLSDILKQLLGNNYKWMIYKNQVLISLKESKSKNQSLSHNKSIKTITDTIKVIINDTVKTNIFDTVKIIKNDTVKIFDTVTVSIIPKENKPIHYFNISIYFSPISKIITKHSYSDDSQMYADIVKQSESNYSGTNYGISIDFEKRRFRYRIGLGYSNITKNIHYDFEKHFTDENFFMTDSVEYWQYKTILYYYKFKDGDIVKIPIIDSSKTYHTFNYKKQYIERTQIRATNSLKTIYLPLSFGYPYYISGNFSITPFVSAQFRYTISNNGYIFNNIDNSVNEINSSIIRRLNISTSISVQFEKKVNSYGRLFIEPAFSYSLQKIYKSDVQINERNNQFDLLLGLRALLFNKK